MMLLQRHTRKFVISTSENLTEWDPLVHTNQILSISQHIKGWEFDQLDTWRYWGPYLKVLDIGRTAAVSIDRSLSPSSGYRVSFKLEPLGAEFLHSFVGPLICSCIKPIQRLWEKINREIIFLKRSFFTWSVSYVLVFS